MLHFDELDLDAPRVGALVDDLLEVGIELLPLRKEVVEIDLPEDAPERGLGELGGRVEVILDIDYTLDRLDNPETKHRIDLDRDIVPGDAQAGVPSTNIAISGCKAHSPEDTPGQINKESLEKAGNLVARVVQKALRRLGG
jgi:hypothetical protein